MHPCFFFSFSPLPWQAATQHTASVPLQHTGVLTDEGPCLEVHRAPGCGAASCRTTIPHASGEPTGAAGMHWAHLISSHHHFQGPCVCIPQRKQGGKPVCLMVSLWHRFSQSQGAGKERWARWRDGGGEPSKSGSNPRNFQQGVSTQLILEGVKPLQWLTSQDWEGRLQVSPLSLPCAVMQLLHCTE